MLAQDLGGRRARRRRDGVRGHRGRRDTWRSDEAGRDQLFQRRVLAFGERAELRSGNAVDGDHDPLPGSGTANELRHVVPQLADADSFHAASVAPVYTPPFPPGVVASAGMPHTLAEKILLAHCDEDDVEPGQIVMVRCDVVMTNDISGPMAFRAMERM